PNCCASCRICASRCSRCAAKWPSPRSASATRWRAGSAPSSRQTRARRTASDWPATANRRRATEPQLLAARETLGRRQREEDDVRTSVAQTRASLDEAERAARELQDRARRVEIDQERARREGSELAERLEQLALERQQLVDGVQAIDRELESASVAADDARARAGAAAEAVEAGRVEDRAIRERESVARAELFRADEAHTSLQGKVNALDALERERVGLAPAAARLLREKEQFGDGAVLGPLSDFISADQSSAL